MTVFLGILLAILMGVVQGITEWLPISSTAHLLLLKDILPAGVQTELFPDAYFNVFKVVIQLGSILAVLVLFWKKLNPWAKGKTESQKRSTYSMWIKVMIASIPAAIIGFLLDDIVDAYLSNALVISIMLVIFGVVFIIMDRIAPPTRLFKISQITPKSAFLVGIGQLCAALFPGTSRSGATITAGLLLGYSRPLITEFSFFMAIPVMLGASAFKMFKYLLDLFKGEAAAFTALQWVMLILAFVTAFIVSAMVIRFLMNFVKKHTFKAFGYYRIALAVVVMAVLVLPALFSGNPIP